ncbi:hypothetical protein ABFX02_04G055800 [Erythranthe guttata]
MAKLFFLLLSLCFLLLCCAPSYTNSHQICKLDLLYQSRDTISGRNFIRQVPVHSMSGHLTSICLDRKDCRGKLGRALSLVGEVSGNYYNDAILQGKTTEELTSMVPDVVDATIDAARKLINLGTTRVVIPGNFPIGCFPIYQTASVRNSSTEYDENQCVKQLNEFAKYHNQQLQQGIERLNEEKPHATVIYADYYKAYQYLLRYARFTGMDTEKACCGIGGKYNFNMTRRCGSRGVPICTDAERYVSWDGVHLTQKSLKIMARSLLFNIFPKLQCRF